MNTVFMNSDVCDDKRRSLLYDGQLFVYSASSSTLALCELAREMSEEAFAPYHPCDAQHHLTVEDYNERLAQLKPAFIHHPKCKEMIRDILQTVGCDLQKTFFDVPRLRTVTSDGYLTAGLGYAFKPHRDTWYSTPMCQLNWWLPVYPIESENSMAFHMHYWNRPIKNSSDEFNYQQWTQNGRKAAPKLVQKDTRRQSEALEPLELEPDVRVVTEPGGMLIFSAAHLHSTVPNTSGKTRFSIDFRTVHLDDLALQRGAHNVDSQCSGTTVYDYLRGSDLAHVPNEVAAIYDSELACSP